MPNAARVGEVNASRFQRFAVWRTQFLRNPLADEFDVGRSPALVDIFAHGGDVQQRPRRLVGGDLRVGRGVERKNAG